MKASPNFDRYQGHLQPYMPEVFKHLDRGMTVHHIARHLVDSHSELRAHYNETSFPEWALAALLTYAIKRCTPPARQLKIIVRPGHMTVPRPRANLGRPLDMGGPRDQWIDRDPWSLL